MLRGMATFPEIGSAAPDFDLPVIGGNYQPGDRVRLADLRGSKVVLYFYPKDDTPGCTQQACGIRDDWTALSARAKLFGISTDPIRRHTKFIEKHALPFPLLSDEAREMVAAYGVWVEKRLYGRNYMGTERCTFLLDEEGRVAAVFRKVKPAEHSRLLLEALS